MQTGDTGSILGGAVERGAEVPADGLEEGEPAPTSRLLPDLLDTAGSAGEGQGPEPVQEEGAGRSTRSPDNPTEGAGTRWGRQLLELWTRDRQRLMAICVKYTLFLLNFIFWVGGLVGGAMGAWLLRERRRVVDDVSDVLVDPSILLLVASVLVFVLAFLGCVGAIRQNLRLLRTFQVMLCTLLLLELLLAALVFLYYAMPEMRRHLQPGPQQALQNAIRRYHDDRNLRDWIDFFQREFRCCGVNYSDEGFLDWNLNRYFNCSPYNPSPQRCAVPVSCCIVKPGDYLNAMCGYGTGDKDRQDVVRKIFTQGCMKGFGQWLSDNDVILGALAVAVITPQVLALVLSQCLVKRTRFQRQRWSLRRQVE